MNSRRSRILPEPTIDGKKATAPHFHRARFEGITMGVTNVLYPLAQVRRSEEAVCHEWFRELPDSIKGLEFYKSIYKCCTSPGLTNAYMQEGLTPSSPARYDDDELVRVLPGLYKDPNVGGDKIGFFINFRRSPRAQSAVRAFRSSRLRPTATKRCNTSNGSRRPTCRRNGGRWAATHA
jgi:hypothetical protein